jgi:hypothetical protein
LACGCDWTLSGQGPQAPITSQAMAPRPPSPPRPWPPRLDGPASPGPGGVAIVGQAGGGPARGSPGWCWVGCPVAGVNGDGREPASGTPRRLPPAPVGPGCDQPWGVHPGGGAHRKPMPRGSEPGMASVRERSAICRGPSRGGRVVRKKPEPFGVWTPTKRRCKGCLARPTRTSASTVRP